MGEASNLVEAVAVSEGLELGLAVFGGDGAGGGHAVKGRAWDGDLLSVLDEELRVGVVFELGDDAKGLQLVQEFLLGWEGERRGVKAM